MTAICPKTYGLPIDFLVFLMYMKTMDNSLSLGKVFYGIFYGAVVAGAYLFLKLTTTDGGMAAFGALCGSMFLFHLILWPRLTLEGLFKREMLFRGLLYGTTQMLIFTAQSQGHSSSTLVAATMGSVFGVILGRIVLRERIRGYALVAAGFCFMAVFSNPLLVMQSYFGVIGGLTQGFGFVVARSLMLKKHSIRQSISTQFFVSGCVTVIVLASTRRLGSIVEFNGHHWFTLFLFAIVIQYGFYHLYKILDSQRASLLTLSRLPSSIALEHLIVGTSLTLGQIVSAANIIVGNIFLLFDAAHSSRQGRMRSP